MKPKEIASKMIEIVEICDKKTDQATAYQCMRTELLRLALQVNQLEPSWGHAQNVLDILNRKDQENNNA